jgi:mono/diheme cytochrome c family protein
VTPQTAMVLIAVAVAVGASLAHNSLAHNSLAQSPMLSTPPQHSVPQPHPGSDPPEPLMTRQVLARGQERYDIFCAPCHGLAGYGDGMVVQRGFPPPPSFHTEPQLDLTAQRVVDVITHGTGQMLPMAERIPITDRWAIAAYLKALQLSQQEMAPGDEPGEEP